MSFQVFLKKSNQKALILSFLHELIQYEFSSVLYVKQIEDSQIAWTESMCCLRYDKVKSQIEHFPFNGLSPSRTASIWVFKCLRKTE